MPKKIVVEFDKCTGCFLCGQACSLVKTGIVNPAAARIRIVDQEESGITVPVICQHCLEPVCLPACPSGAISRDSQTGIVSIDAETCTNCTTCRKVCPFAGPVFSASEKRVVLCDHCGGEPICVSVCPTEALHYRECPTGVADERLRAMSVARKTIAKKERQQ